MRNHFPLKEIKGHIIFGIACGFIFFIGESIAGIIAGNDLSLMAYIIFAPVYILLGIIIAFFVWTIFKIGSHIIKKELNDSILKRIVFSLIAFSWVYFQVFIFNYKVITQ